MASALQMDPQQQMQQLQMQMAMMSMASGATNGSMMVGSDGNIVGAGATTMPPPPPPAPPVQDASSLAFAAAQGAQLGGAPSFGADPTMTQAFMQMYNSYLQQATQAYASLGATTDGSVPQAPSVPNYALGQSPSLPVAAAISVCVEGMKFQYQLTEDDLQKVFGRYGRVREILVDQAGTKAQIAFEDYTFAQAAMNDLNGKILNGLEGTLRIEWAANGTIGAPTTVPPPYPVMPSFPGANWGFPNAAAWPTTATVPSLGQERLPSMGDSPPPPGTPPPHSGALALSPMTAEGKAPAHVKGVRKYTCRFLIGIENDKDFQVVRRIIGAKGTNMKRIVKLTEAKLRLRGVGSGYFEGASRKESSEPLQLCVSCTSPDGYQTAVNAVEELMEGVYHEYRTFCAEMGRPEPDLHATPQLVSSGRDRGSLTPMKQPMLDDDDEDDDDNDDNSPGKREGGRRRGRRSRGKKTEAGQAQKGEPPRNAPSVEEILHCIDSRNEARRQCNFTEADNIRQSLHERGVALMDEPGGRGKASEVTTWRYWRE